MLNKKLWVKVMNRPRRKREDITNKIMQFIFDEFNAEYPENINDLALIKVAKQAGVDTFEGK